jgi:hypothetical protein
MWGLNLTNQTPNQIAEPPYLAAKKNLRGNQQEGLSAWQNPPFALPSTAQPPAIETIHCWKEKDNQEPSQSVLSCS